MLNRGVGGASAFMGVRDTAVCLKLFVVAIGKSEHEAARRILM